MNKDKAIEILLKHMMIIESDAKLYIRLLDTNATHQLATFIEFRRQRVQKDILAVINGLSIQKKFDELVKSLNTEMKKHNAHLEKKKNTNIERNYLG